MSELIYNSQHIAAQFSRAVDTYNEAASLQMEYVKQGLQDLSSIRINARILDLGAGTGNFAKLANQLGRDWKIFGVDISKSMCAYAKGEQHSINANMQQMPFAAKSFDAAISAFALQWSNAPKQVFEQLYSCLKPDASCIIQSFAYGTLGELKLCAEHAGFPDVVNPFYTSEDYQEMMVETGFALEQVRLDTHIKLYESPWKLFQELKALGATSNAAARRKGLNSRQKLKDIATYYMKHFGDSYGIPAAWNVVYIRARKLS